MPTPSISTKIAMDGEKEYKQALSEINSGLKVLSSEMALTSVKFAENADGMEALTAKGDILERQILSQKEKIETLKAALQNSAEAYGESDKKTSAWKVSLNNAEAELVRMERELRDNREAVQEAAQAAQDAEKAFDDMADALGENAEAADGNKSIMDKLRDAFGGAEDGGKSLGEMVEDLAGKLGVNLPDGAKEALDTLGDVNAEAVALAGAAAAAAAALVKIEQALIGITTERASVATSLANIAETINMDVEATQQWNYVLQTVGSSIEDAQGDLSAFQEKIMEAREGTGEAAEMFTKLGISVVDQNGKLRNTNDVLLDVIHALQNMHDVTERNAISSSLLGSLGEKLAPIYAMTAQELEYLLDKKYELGVLTAEEISQLKNVTEALIDYEEKVAAAKDAIAVEFAPALTEFYEQAGNGIKTLGEAAADSGLISLFGSLLEILSSLLPLLEGFSILAHNLSPVLDGLAIGIKGVADAISVVTEALSSVSDITSAMFKSDTSIGLGFSDVFGKIGTLYNAFSALGNPKFNASGDWNFDGGYTWVGENGPELAYFPQGTRIINNQESREMGGDTFYVTIDAKNVREFNDIVEMAKSRRRKTRMEADKR